MYSQREQSDRTSEVILAHGLAGAFAEFGELRRALGVYREGWGWCVVLSLEGLELVVEGVDVFEDVLELGI